MKKNKFKLTLIAALSVTTIMGCAVQPEKVQPRSYSDKYSYAYNIANQTALTRDSSPLRDFTQEEINEAKTQLTEKNPGDEPIFTGTLFMLAGTLIDIIDVAGGAMANLAEQPHEASHSRWIIAVPIEKFKSEEQAQEYIITTIHTAAKKALAKYGEVSEQSAEKNPQVMLTKVKTSKDSYSIGLVRPKNLNKKHLLVRTIFPFNGQPKEVYAYGFNRDDRTIQKLLIANPTPSFLATEYTKLNISDFNKQLTSYLPYGFFLYTPSFPKFSGYGKIFTYPSEIVPAIYSQGKKYEFIKPDSAE